MQFVYAGIISSIISKILSPIIKLVGSILVKVFNWAFENLLEPILVAVFKEVWKFLTELLSSMLSNTLHKLELALMDIIDAMLRVAGILIGAESVSLDGKNVKLLDMLLQDSRVRNLFFGIMILSIALVSVLSMYAMLKAQMEIDARQRRTAARVARSIIQTFITFFGGYAYVAIVVALGGVLVKACCALVDHWVSPGGSLGYVLEVTHSTVVEAYGGSSEIIGYAVSVFCGILLILSLLRTTLSIVRRIYDIAILYVTQPFYAVTIVLDDGATYKRYRDFFTGRVLIGIGTYLCLLLVGRLWAPVIATASIDAGIGDADINKMVGVVLRLVLILGGVKASENVPTLLGQVIGDHAAMVDMQSRSKFDSFLPFNLGRL